VKKKKVIRKSPLHGQRGDGRVPHPVCVEVAEAFHAMRMYCRTLETQKDKKIVNPDAVKFLSSFIRDKLNECIVALLKLAAGRGNPFPDIDLALRKGGKPRLKTLEVVKAYYDYLIEHGEPPSYKDLCYRLFGSKWTDGQEAFVRKVAREHGLQLKPLS
jgi:hypothetical protein